MPTRLESDLEKRVCEDSKKKEWWPLKLVAIGHRGFPDRWFIKDTPPGHPPRIVIIEFKAEGKRARKLQLWVCQKMEDMGFEVWWDVDTYEKAAEILDL